MDQSPIKYCNNCNSVITCGCQYRTASDGYQVCDICLNEYEESISRLKTFSNNIKEFVSVNNLVGNYCIILYTYQGKFENPVNKIAQHVYKSIEDFEIKALNNINKIDKSLGIDFQVCTYE